MQHFDSQLSPYQSLSLRMASLKSIDVVNKEGAPVNKGSNQIIIEENSMQEVVRPYILLAQCFGLLPVRGIFSRNPNDLQFSWTSKRTVYALVLLSAAVTVFVLHLASSLKLHGFNYTSVDNMINSNMSVVVMIIFLCQARSWPKLMVEWTKVEHQMKHFPPLVGLHAKIKYFVYSFFMGVGFLLLARILGPMLEMQRCTDDVWSILKLAIISKYQTLAAFCVLGSSWYGTAPLAIMFLHQNVLKVFDELTITVLAYCLHLRFRQLRYHLIKNIQQRMPSTYWVEMRETYNNLSCLTKLLDKHLSWMTLVCFAVNLYHICSLLYKTLRPQYYRTSYWFVLYELAFALVRTFTAALVASSVYEESKKPLSLLFFVPSDSYNGEVCRFQMQVTHDELAITGCNFFSLTRSFMLTVAGTIATYEIVLLQFGTFNETSEIPLNATDACSEIIHFVK